MADPGLPSGLPGAEYLLARQGFGTTDATGTAASLRKNYPIIAPLAIGWLARALSIPMPAKTIIDERMLYTGRTLFIVPRYQPVNQILAAFPGGSRSTLRVGTEPQIARGQADIAISDQGRVIRCRTWAREIFVTYNAGMKTLPPELVEVFAELTWLMFKEKDRVGVSNEKVDVGLLGFTRKLPEWCRQTLDGYKRAAVYV